MGAEWCTTVHKVQSVVQEPWRVFCAPLQARPSKRTGALPSPLTGLRDRLSAAERKEGVCGRYLLLHDWLPQ